IVNNDHLLVNTKGTNCGTAQASGCGDDNGANAIQFFKTTGASMTSGNTVHGNWGPSYDYTVDGGAFEIYGASDITIKNNTHYDTLSTQEPGTNKPVAGVTQQPCPNNKIIDNTFWGGMTQAEHDAGAVSPGIIIRCAQNMLIANNTFENMDWWVFDFSQNSG